MTIELDTTLAQAEVLFLSFTQLVADLDRRNAESANRNELRKRYTSNTSSGSSTPRNTDPKAPLLSDDLRELLKAGR